MAQKKDLIETAPDDALNTELTLDGSVAVEATPNEIQPLTLLFTEVKNDDGSIKNRFADGRLLTNIPVNITQREYAFICFLRAFGTGILEGIDVKNGSVEVVATMRQRIDFSTPKALEQLFNARPDSIIVKL